MKWKTKVLLLGIVFLVSISSAYSQTANFTNDLFNQSTTVTDYYIYADFTNNITEADHTNQNDPFIHTDPSCTSTNTTLQNLKCTSATTSDLPGLNDQDSDGNKMDVVYQFMINITDLAAGNAIQINFGTRDGSEYWSQFSGDVDAQSRFHYFTKTAAGGANNWKSNFTIDENKLYIIRIGINRSQGNKFLDFEIFDENGSVLQKNVGEDRRDWDNCNTGQEICGGFGGEHLNGENYLDELRMWNWTNHGWDGPDAAVSDIIEPGFSSLANNATATTRNQTDVNFTVTLTEDTALADYIWSTVNVTTTDNIWVNETPQTASGTSFTTSLSKSITVAAGTQICAKVYANDTSANENESQTTCFTVANTPPPQCSIVTPATDPDRDNKNISFDCSDVTDADSDAVTYQFYINLTTSDMQLVYDDSLSNWTSNFTQDAVYKYVWGTYDGEEYGVNTTEQTFELDTVSPTVSRTKPSTADNITNTNTFTLNWTCSDNQAIFGCNATVYNSSNELIFSSQSINLAGTSFNNETTVDWTSYHDQIFTINISAEDDHTRKRIPAYGREKDNTNKKIKFSPPSGIDIDIGLVNFKYPKVDFSTTKLDDRYTVKYDFSSLPPGQKKKLAEVYKFFIKSNEIIHYRQNSNFNAHFVTGKHWIDFEFQDKNANYLVTKISDFEYHIEIDTNETVLDFQSMGGLNEYSETLFFEKDTTAPGIVINEITDGENFSFSSLQWNATGTELNPDILRLMVNGIENQTISYTSGSKASFTAVNFADGVYNVTVIGNDTAANVNDSVSNVTITVDTTPPSVSLSGGTTNASTFLSQNWLYVNISVTEINERNRTYRLYNSSALQNETTFTDSTSTLNFTDLNEDNYSINVTVYDTADNVGESETRISIVLDTTLPIVNLESPINGTSTSTTNTTFSYNISNDNVSNGNATLFLNKVLNQTDISITAGISQSFNSVLLSVGEHNWTVQVIDNANNAKNATFITTITQSAGGGGEGAGGGSSSGGGGAKAQEQTRLQTQSLLSTTTTCNNNGICEDTETLFSCSADCALNFDNALWCFEGLRTLPIVSGLYEESQECRWSEGWFIQLLALSVVAVFVLRDKKGKKQDSE